MSEVLAQREAVMVGLPMARWIDNIRENRSFSTTIAIVFLSRHTAVDVTVTAESVTEESFTDYRKATFENLKVFLSQEQPFVGILVSVFPDGSQRERRVEAVIQVGSYHFMINRIYENLVTFGIIA